MSDSHCNSNNFKEAVCVEAQRIFDSCSDKDCLEDLEVVFSDVNAQKIIDEASSAKCKCVDVATMYFNIEPVPFNKGFYSVDITYIFNVTVEACVNSCMPAQTVVGTSRFCKKVVLYGSDATAKLFKSDEKIVHQPTNCCSHENLPVATVRAVEPIVLDTKLVKQHHHHHHHHHHENCNTVPEIPLQEATNVNAQNTVLLTLGLFSIVSLQRPVSLLIPAYDFCIPEKDCSTTNDSPCELFEKIKFPTDQFFPSSLEVPEESSWEE